MSLLPTSAGGRRGTPLAFALLTALSSQATLAQTEAPPAAPATPQPPAARPAATPGASTPATLREVKVNASAGNRELATNQSSLKRLGEDLRDVPQSVTVINQALMQSQGATSLASALRNVPGLTIGGAEGSQIGTNINLNGFTARTDLYLDGARDRAQYYRDTFALDAIEVLMGPSSMLFGRGSTGGVINQVSKTPTLKPGTEVQVSATTNGLVRTVLDHNQPLSDTSAFRVAVMGQDGNATDRDQSRLRDFGVAPSLKLGIGTPTQVTLSGLFQHNNDQPDYGLPNLNGAPAPVARTLAYGFSDDRTISNIAALSAQVEHRITPTRTLRNQTQFNYVTTDARETAPNAIGTLAANGSFVALPTGTTAVPAAASSNLPLSQLWVRQQSHDRVIRDQSFYNVTELTDKLAWGSTRHSLLAGIELGADNYNNQNYYRNGSCNGTALNPAGGTSGYVSCEPLLSPSTGASPSNAPSVAGNLATGQSTTLAGYVNDTIELNAQFKLVAGLRFDRFSASVGNSMPNSTTPAAVSQTVNKTSVRGGGIWQPTPTQSYYLSYSTSFDPSLEQLVNTTGTSGALAPASNKAYEGGGKWDLNDGKLTASAALFQITQYNAASKDNNGNYTATGTVRVNGARAGLAGQLNDRWQVFGGYTYLDATIINGVAPGTQGMVPANTPKNSASLWSTYALTPEWEIGGGPTFSSARYANNTDLVRVGEYTRWDAMLAYHQRQYDVRLNLFNLGNKYYYDALIPSDGGRAVPGLGRTASITVNYRF
ncbi:MAG: TonB-dependent siderophore receptor [Curvibacter sp.]|nr:TonB-dependent siderophore receptor [Curvibacter sp.]